jgi:hypothetical protein
LWEERAGEAGRKPWRPALFLPGPGHWLPGDEQMIDAVTVDRREVARLIAILH